MKPIFTILFCCLFLAASAQDEDYYRKIYTKPIGAKPYNTESLLKKFGDIKVHDRWYVGVNGFVRKDNNTIDNDFDGLIGTQSPTVSSWGISTGWVYKEQWNIELAYDRSAIHNVLMIYGDNPLSYQMENDKNNLILRGKMRLLFGKPSVRKSAFWVSAGAGLVPNSGRAKEFMEFSGYRERGRRLGVDTLYMSSDTRISKSMTGLVEASAEYVIKVAKSIDMSIFARKQWGIGNSITTDLVYKVNGVETERARIEGDGSGWNFGISLRYVFHIGYDFSPLNHGKI
ncbi:hypothetical protein GCM10010967_39100 [Dyadobacter beijingensis]|uniref:Outer membrane protein beta-barrel domain-containing protein n=1 Tax=Dyadobacter beijingensis TaxID=365489 RepID=A0ABQ2I8D9_9BACT|nr:hypothetical protein [Dyadobacter beijingensis]GGN00943.1 hypothetical protein GCM10010967_39100 [Dyadobacter beijingensis]